MDENCKTSFWVSVRKKEIRYEGRNAISIKSQLSFKRIYRRQIADGNTQREPTQN
jgi:hypothetical protein